jgi:hypothetical protein
MLGDPKVGTVVEHIEHMNCRKQVKMDDLWQCLASAPSCCPDLIIYGPTKYCMHKDHVGFGASTERYGEGTSK